MAFSLTLAQSLHLVLLWDHELHATPDSHVRCGLIGSSMFDGPVGMTLCRIEENGQDLKPAPGTYVEVVVVNRIVKFPPGYDSDEEKD
ncbi:unnamed protein product [Euphydryas editha]|uniref:Uncharacterized protein n=1 Tax=Euphydryas editha TaxID=104508 RepID=A0AAU9V4W8_EUPED|nr:unnamed protein product [Euphydryas editha]